MLEEELEKTKEEVNQDTGISGLLILLLITCLIA